MKQGRETASFLDALGRVIVTRRGNSNNGGAAQYILCGRQFHNGIAFDEEDMKNPSLCSGFPFLVNSAEKLYLWKGIGASSLELEYANRVAADLSPDGFEEVAEGSEPKELLEVFAQSSEEKASAKYWEMKPAHKNYTARLFKFDIKTDSHVSFRILPGGACVWC